VWLACSALEDDEEQTFIKEYTQEAQAFLAELDGEIRFTLPSPSKVKLDELRMFLMRLEQALTDGGTTRLMLSLRKRPGRPRQSVAAYRAGMRAVEAVERLVADGCKQEAAVAEVGAHLGLSRTEIFRWLKNRREQDRRSQSKTG